FFFFSLIEVQTFGSGISNLLAVVTTFTGSGNLYCQEEGYDEEEEEDELYRDVNINQGRGMESIFETTSQMDVRTPTTVAPLHMTAPTITPSTIATINTTQRAPIPPTTAPSTLLQYLPNFGSLFGFDNRLKTFKFECLCDEAQKENDEFRKTMDENIQKFIKEQVKEQVKVQVSKILPKIEQIVNEQLEAKVFTRSSNSSKTSYDVVADLSEMELKEIIIQKIKGNKDVAMMMLIKMKNPPLDQTGGSKRRREGKEPVSASAPKEKAARSAGKSTQGYKSRQTLASEYATTEKLMQTTFQMEEPSHPEFETSANDQPIVESSQHPEWFSQKKKPPTPDRDWNKTLPVTYGSIQPWISELAKQSDSRSSFNEMMDTPMDFSNFLMNRLKFDTLTPELLVGPTYELMKGHAKAWGKRQQFYDFAVNRESARDVYSKRRIIAVIELEIVEWHNYKHLDWITVQRDDDKLYKFKEGDFKRLHIQDIEDILSSNVYKKHRNPKACGRPLTWCRYYQKKLNLTRPDTYRSDLKRKDAYSAYSNPRGFIYQNKDKQNKLMRIDELHKFSYGTLTDVRTALDDCLKGIQMKYLPKSIWRKSDKDRAAAMIHAIDKMLKTKRIMRSLERSGSPLNLAEDDLSLVNLKFIPKGKIDEVFGIKIPKELIMENIKNAPYYNAYLEMVAKHERRIAAAKEGGKKKTTPKADKPMKPAQAKPTTAKKPQAETC
nr:histone deacetylase 14 [Tanacetum cinerariifolium]